MISIDIIIIPHQYTTGSRNILQNTVLVITRPLKNAIALMAKASQDHDCPSGIKSYIPTITLLPQTDCMLCEQVHADLGPPSAARTQIIIIPHQYIAGRRNFLQNTLFVFTRPLKNAIALSTALLPGTLHVV